MSNIQKAKYSKIPAEEGQMFMFYGTCCFYGSHRDERKLQQLQFHLSVNDVCMF